MDTTLEAHIIATIITGLILAIDLVIRLILLFYVPRNRKPTAALAWLLAIIVVPIIGTALFFVIGSTKLSRRRREMQQQVDRMYGHYRKQLDASKLIAKAPRIYRQSAALAESLTQLAPTKGNKVGVINGYDKIIQEMIAAIDEATSYVYIEFFALALDKTTEPFFAALENATKRGVSVYVLFDTLGSRKYPRYREMKRRLTDIGVSWNKVLAIRLRLHQYNRPDLRNHRKIVVVDNRHAFLGSLNMIDRTYHRKDTISYIELVTHLEGPAVNEAAAVFASDWYGETEQILTHFLDNTSRHSGGHSVAQILPSGPAYAYRNNLKVFVDLIYTAKDSILITNPYLVPDESLLAALLSASLRGVRVSILNSEAMDQWMVGHAQRSYYDELLSAGIHVSLYNAPQLLHSKYMVVDEEVAVIGSSNLDIRSFELNLECSAIIYDKSVAATLARQHSRDLKKSQSVILALWRRRSKWSQLLDSIARLTSALQ